MTYRLMRLRLPEGEVQAKIKFDFQVQSIAFLERN